MGRGREATPAEEMARAKALGQGDELGWMRPQPPGSSKWPLWAQDLALLVLSSCFYGRFVLCAQKTGTGLTVTTTAAPPLRVL